MTKLTKTNFKSFIKKNANRLQVKLISRFDGTTDGVESIKDAAFRPAVKTTHNTDNTFGVDDSVWLVGGGRDYFDAYDVDGFVGIKVSNACGSFVVAVNSADLGGYKPATKPTKKTKYQVAKDGVVLDTRSTNRTYTHALVAEKEGATTRVIGYCGSLALSMKSGDRRHYEQSGYKVTSVPVEVIG